MLEIICELILQVVVELFLAQACQFVGWAVVKGLTLGQVNLEEEMATAVGLIFVLMVGGFGVWRLLS